MKKPSDLLRQLSLNTKSCGMAKVFTDPNIRQVRNFQQKIRQERKRNDDEILNVKHLEEFMGDTYIRHHKITPSQQIIVALPENVEEFRHVLRTIDEDHTLELHYDTSFEFSNKYLSTLSYRHPLTERKTAGDHVRSKHPIVPLVSQLHETRSKNDHINFLQESRRILGEENFNRQHKVFITDEEFRDINMWENTNQVNIGDNV